MMGIFVLAILLFLWNDAVIDILFSIFNLFFNSKKR